MTGASRERLGGRLRRPPLCTRALHP